MQHPVGYQMENNLFKAVSLSAVIFDPANFPRFLHMLFAAYISASFVIVSVSALYLLKNQHRSFAKTCFSFTWLALLILVPAQIFFGDMAGLEVHKNQPIKTAAMEGLWETSRGAPFLIIGWPNQAQQKNDWALEIPHGAALINTHQWDGKLIGLKSVPPEDQPHVTAVFYTFRIMVYLGMLMLLLALVALYLRYKNKLYDQRGFLLISLLTAPIGFIALWCGWLTAELGRQPWAVYGILRTAQAVSKVPVHDVLLSFVLIVLVYGVIFGYFYFYFLHKLIHKGPGGLEKSHALDQPFHYMSSATTDKESS